MNLNKITKTKTLIYYLLFSYFFFQYVNERFSCKQYNIDDVKTNFTLCILGCFKQLSINISEEWWRISESNR